MNFWQLSGLCSYCKLCLYSVLESTNLQTFLFGCIPAHFVIIFIQVSTSLATEKYLLWKLASSLISYSSQLIVSQSFLKKQKYSALKVQFSPIKMSTFFAQNVISEPSDDNSALLQLRSWRQFNASALTVPMLSKTLT